MNRDRFMKTIECELNKIIKLYAEKNESYGRGEDAFYNFRETAYRVHGDASHESMWRVILTYMDKHMIALSKGIDEKEFTERCRDIIVYSLLAIGLREDWEDSCHEQPDL